MRFHRAIRILVLTTFLPTALGCASRRTVDLHSDPGSQAEFLADGKPVQISGFTMSDGEVIDWDGHVSSDPPESLKFVPAAAENLKKGATFGGGSTRKNAESETFRLARVSVRSLNVVELQVGRTLALGIPVAFLGVFVVAVVGMAVDGGGVYGN
jgi:hypothetical protein